MKICPICQNEHQNRGKSCSKECATKMRGLGQSVWWNSLSSEKKAELSKKYNPTKASQVFSEKCRKIRDIPTDIDGRKKIHNGKPTPDFDGTNWDEISFEKKRRQVLKEQNFTCIRCNLDTWLNEPITLELDHVDGNNSNNERVNLRALCPNCHSKTETWRSANKRKRQYVSDNELIASLKENNHSIRQALLSVGMTPKGNNYNRMKRLIANNPGIYTGYAGS